MTGTWLVYELNTGQESIDPEEGQGSRAGALPIVVILSLFFASCCAPRPRLSRISGFLFFSF